MPHDNIRIHVENTLGTLGFEGAELGISVVTDDGDLRHYDAGVPGCVIRTECGPFDSLDLRRARKVISMIETLVADPADWPEAIRGAGFEPVSIP